MKAVGMKRIATTKGMLVVQNSRAMLSKWLHQQLETQAYNTKGWAKYQEMGI
jgi:hypothetical protein